MPGAAESTGTTRFDQVDLLKALAIVAVVSQHGLPFPDRLDTYGSLWTDQAVPVFVVLTGLLLARFRMVGPLPWRGVGASQYLRRRFARLLIPFGVTWVAALAVGVLIGSIYFGILTLLGALPIVGPGNYYIPVAIQLVLLTPVVAWACRRWAGPTLVVCLAVNILFELLWSQAGFAHRGGSEFVYDAISLRYLFLLALGVWLTVAAPKTWRDLRWLILGAAVAVVYLLIEHGRTDMLLGFGPGFERRTNFLVACYPALLVALGMRWLPASAPRLLQPAVTLGRASYHVYLVQIVWFGALPDQSLGRFVTALAAVVAIGLVFYRLVPGRWPPAPLGSHAAPDAARVQHVPTGS
jgi:peptidoglycan/LPS O-acetylase OafA/YrhL